MDLSLLPKILSIAVFILAFRPLVRRVGAHTDTWFVGWGCMLVHAILQALPQWQGAAGMVEKVLIAWTIDLCALAFMLAASNSPSRRISNARMAEFAAPVLLQSMFALLGPAWHAAQYLSCLLFFAPAIHMLMQRTRRNRSVLIVSLAYAAFAVIMLPLAASQADAVTQGALTLLFLSAAYLYLMSATKVTRGVVAAVVGLVGWGLRFPVLGLMARFRPDVHLSLSLFDLPCYLMAAGIILALLEEHLLRTERLAMHDPLTDLPNRRLFEERLIATMEDARVHNTTVACLVIDVDNFKTINDTLGHTAGDQLLRSLSVRLSWHMGPRDLLARTGGDEFTALLAGVSDEHHLRFIAAAMMSAASVPINIDGKSVDVRISVGIALSPDDADDIDSLRRAADEAMYSAKRRGGSLLAFAGDR